MRKAIDILIGAIVFVITYYLARGPKAVPPRVCAYYSHEQSHTNTLINLTRREVRDLHTALKNAGAFS